MGFFFKKPMTSVEYEKLAKRITDVEIQIDKLHSAFMSLRGLIHRKFTGDIAGDVDAMQQDKKSETLKDSVLLPDDYGIGKK
ncbi:unnamed protein product [marine sediment metagenome]|uniref:Type I restriction modification DNA specificity domain-containing protein n=1 Tax=marine sediment metagenome TaxID=412755 RepID=X1MX09_9ZZZZ